MQVYTDASFPFIYFLSNASFSGKADLVDHIWAYSDKEIGWSTATKSTKIWL